MNIKSFSLNNCFGSVISVECDITNGLPSLNIIGLARGAVKESDSRVRAGLTNSGMRLPPKRIVVNLYPADVVKEESFFDLAIAVKILDATNQIEYESVERYEYFQHLVGIMFLGELHLNGQIAQVNGVLAAVIEGARQGIKDFVIPKANCLEASAIDGINIYGVESLSDIKDFFNGKLKAFVNKRTIEVVLPSHDFSDSYIDSNTSFILTVLAAGHHNALFFGPPGTGKSMFAKRIPSLLPMLDSEKVLETSKIYSVAGLLKFHNDLIRIPPFRQPHHSSSVESLVGGGGNASPGEVSLAHNGILMLDELPEFKPSAIQSLREPIESKKIIISRAAYKMELPADFMLIATMNLCPCGNYGKIASNCICSYYQKRKYINRVGGAILDRFDLGLCFKEQELDLQFDPLKNYQSMKQQSETAHEIQALRYKSYDINYNNQLSFNLIKDLAMLGVNEEDYLKEQTKLNRFSLRNILSVIKLARTIEDLRENNTKISQESIKFAINLKKALFDPLNFYHIS